MAPETYFRNDNVTLYLGDALEVVRTLPSESVNCVVTSPPYFGLRDYGIEGQYGHEATPQGFAETLCDLFREVRRVLTDDGTVWLNLGDSYMARQFGWGNTSEGSWAAIHREAGDERPAPARTGHPLSRSGAMEKASGIRRKNLIGVPWRTAFALQDDGWILRNDVIWAKPNGKPGGPRDRLHSRHEYVFMLTKSLKYAFDLSALDSIGDVWTITTKPFPEAHFATFPPELARRCVLAGCPEGGTVLDPFSGSGTTGMVALEQGKKYIGIDLNPEYLDLSLRTRLKEASSGA